jgi:hypothetical protein
MGHRAVTAVTRQVKDAADVVVAVDFSRGPVDPGSLVTVFVTQAGGAIAIGSQIVPPPPPAAPPGPNVAAPQHFTGTLEITATLQDPDNRRFSPDDPLTVSSQVTEIWNSVLLTDPGAAPDPIPVRKGESVPPAPPTVWKVQW